MPDDHDIELCRQFFSRVHKPGTRAHEVQTAAAYALRHGGALTAMELAEQVDKANAELTKKQRRQHP
ncbi:hypothetical protein SBE55_20005 [Mycolicibacterium sp. 141076]|uniref:hypothetical protein n=1 Tax=Mycobacteriaceae TaxID=1762 RepID=UPI00299F351C|nr:hypothetical protein [Mycolicibacterium sp. 141076]MDX1880090.1 hypothetical protein [Mycolicibacterium sp. 141076]